MIISLLILLAVVLLLGDTGGDLIVDGKKVQAKIEDGKVVYEVPEGIDPNRVANVIGSNSQNSKANMRSQQLFHELFDYDQNTGKPIPKQGVTKAQLDEYIKSVPEPVQGKESVMSPEQVQKTIQERNRLRVEYANGQWQNTYNGLSEDDKEMFPQEIKSISDLELIKDRFPIMYENSAVFAEQTSLYAVNQAKTQKLNESQFERACLAYGVSPENVREFCNQSKLPLNADMAFLYSQKYPSAGAGIYVPNGTDTTQKHTQIGSPDKKTSKMSDIDARLTEAIMSGDPEKIGAVQKEYDELKK